MESALHHLFGGVENATDKSDLFRPCGGDVVRRIGQFAGHALTHDVGQPLKDADIGDKADGGLLQAENGIFTADTDITGGGHIQTRSDAPSMDGGNDRFPTPFDAAHGILKSRQFSYKTRFHTAPLVLFH